jgi:ABC-type sugar transport system ATPase subunit
LPLKIENLIKRYDSDFQFGPIDIEIENEILVVLGENGAGKTTLLNLIGGLLEPDEGRILINERLLNQVPIESRNVGYIFQRLYLFPHLNVLSNILYGLPQRNVIRRLFSDDSLHSEKVKRIVSLFGIDSLLTRNIQSLSGGEQQKVALARTLVTSPQLLLMDEPFASLDVITRYKLMTEIRHILADLNLPIVYVTHNPNEALALADKVLVLNRGKVIDKGTKQDVLIKPKNEFVKMLLGTLWI